MKKSVTLYRQGAYGLNEWTITADGDTLTMHANSQEYTEKVEGGKAGRSLADQVQLRMDARIRSKLDGGFKRTRAEASSPYKTNQLGLPLPMLATHAKNIRNLDDTFHLVQPKLDGHRCIMFADEGGKVMAYSRAGRPIEAITHIVNSIKLPKGVFIDGELYVHGEALQTISSWAKRKQPDTAKIEYHVYDAFIPYEPSCKYLDRWARVKRWFNSHYHPSVKLVETLVVGEHPQIDFFNKYRSEGYEGAILRDPKGLYRPGMRKHDLIKVKRRFDDEFECVDVSPSRDNWGILHLRAKNGKVFKTPAPGTMISKERVLNEKEKFIGKFVTCEYAELTKEGIPFHCVAMRWRIDL